MGRTSCQQELYAQSVAAVCSVSSSKQFNKGNACLPGAVCECGTDVTSLEAQEGAAGVQPDRPKPRIRRVPRLVLFPALQSESHMCAEALAVRKQQRRVAKTEDFLSLSLRNLILKWYVPQSFYFEDSKHTCKAKFRVCGLKNLILNSYRTT